MPFFRVIFSSISLVWLYQGRIDAFTSQRRSPIIEQRWKQPQRHRTTIYSKKYTCRKIPTTTTTPRSTSYTSLFMSTRDKTGFKDYYRILGVSRKADTNEIKQAYRRLAKIYHPDSKTGNKNDSTKFQELNRAYEVLRNPRLRMHYDMEGGEGIKQKSTYGDGFGDFTSKSPRSTRTVRTQSEDHTHVEFGDMSDPYYRGKGKGPFNGSGAGGSSIPSDQASRFNRAESHGEFMNDVHVDRGSRSDFGSRGAADTSKTTTTPKSKPFSDERFYGKSPDKADSFFGGNRPGANFGRTMVGDDIRVDWEVDLRTALLGGEEVVRVPCKETCTTCEGSGAKPGTDISICEDCGGKGSTTQKVQTPRGNTINTQQKCATCKGTGQIIEDPCASCGSQGMKKATKHVNITVPAFMEDGIMIRLLGEGNPGPNRGPPGDLYVFLWAKDDPTFYREGDRIYSEESIDFLDAVLGCTVETPYIKFDVPPGTQNDYVVRLKGEGPPKRNNPKERGTHVVTVKVEIPKSLSKEEEKLFMKLKDLRDRKKKKKKDKRL